MPRHLRGCLAALCLIVLVATLGTPAPVAAQGDVRIIPIQGILPGFALAPDGSLAAVYESAQLFPQLAILELPIEDVVQPIRLIDLTSGEVRAELSAAPDLVSEVAFSPDGALLAAHYASGTIVLWDVATGELRAPIPFLPAIESFLRFLPDGETLVAVHHEAAISQIHLVDVATGHFNAILTHRFDTIAALTEATIASQETGALTIQGLAVLPDGSALLTAGGDGSLWRWDLTTGQPTLIREGDDYLSLSARTLRILPDGQTLAFFARGTGSLRWTGSIHFWDLTTGDEAYTIPSIPRDYALSPDGNTLAWFDAQTGVMTFMNRFTLGPQTNVDVPPQPGLLPDVMGGSDQSGIAFTPDGAHVIMTGGVAFPPTVSNALYVIDVP